jgi:pimeloyl-ACP methyl ester carboxylesterase
VQRTIARPHDETVAYEVRGSGAPVVVLAHNLMCDRRVFDASRLDTRTINVDLRGHGASTARAPFRLRDLADDVLAILDAEAVDAAVLVGLSLGASAAIDLALAHPSRVLGLALLSPCGVKATRAESLRDTLVAKTLGAVGMPHEIARRIGTAVFGASFRAESPEVVAAWIETIASRDPTFTAHALRAWSARADVLADLARIRAASVVVVGEEDEPNPPAEGERVAAALGARLVRIPRAGHTMPLERPDEVYAALTAFVASLRD